MNSAAVCLGGLSAGRWGWLAPCRPLSAGVTLEAAGCGPGDRCAQGGVLVRVVVTGSSPAWLWPFTSVGQRSSHRAGTSSLWGGTALAVTR